MSDVEDQTNQMLDNEDQTDDKMSEDTEEQTNNNNNNTDNDNNNKQMTDTEDPDKFAEEIVESGVVRKTVKRSYIIQEVSIYQIHM